MDDQTIVKVALPVPLHRTFDFIWTSDQAVPKIGARVRVPFGSRRLIGIVLDQADRSLIPLHRLRPICDVLDTAPLFSEKLLTWLQWIADYYHHPVGEVLFTALPIALRRGQLAEPKPVHHYRLTHKGRAANPEFKRAPLQKKLWQALYAESILSPGRLSCLSKSWQRSVRSMIDKGWVEATLPHSPQALTNTETLTLNDEQDR